MGCNDSVVVVVCFFWVDVSVIRDPFLKKKLDNNCLCYGAALVLAFLMLTKADMTLVKYTMTMGGMTVKKGKTQLMQL